MSREEFRSRAREEDIPQEAKTRSRALGAALVVAGGLLILTPSYIFPVCGKGRYAPAPGEPVGVHRCHGTLTAETSLGVLAMGLGLIPMLWPNRRATRAVSLAALAMAALVILFPLAITGVCMMPTMPCRLGTLPALIVLGVIMAAIGAGGMVLSRKPT